MPHSCGHTMFRKTSIPLTPPCASTLKVRKATVRLPCLDKAVLAQRGRGEVTWGEVKLCPTSLRSGKLCTLEVS